MVKRPRQDKMFCTTVRLPKELHQRLKIRVIREGITIQKAIEALVRAFVA